MRVHLKITDFGVLVRPKTITRLLLWDKQKSISDWWHETSYLYRWKKREKKQQLTDYYKCSLEELFEDLLVGNPATAPESSYVCEIKSFIVLFCGQVFLIENLAKANTFVKKINKLPNSKKDISILAVGLKFYKNMQAESGSIAPNVPWQHTKKEDNVWLYHPKDLIPLENIIKFEQIKVGHYVVLKKTSGIVVKISSKTNFLLNSATSKNIIFFTTRLKMAKLLAEKRFVVYEKST